MHNHILEQIKSFVTEDLLKKKVKNYILYKDKLRMLPEIPNSFLK